VQLRLVSDENLVQIVTIHKSKGLKYPVALCPFVWNGGLHLGKSGRSYQFHDPTQDWAAVLELGSKRMEEDRPLTVGEELAERLRLLYVALHRYLTWRLPGYRYERQFGGVFYPFLRGMDPRSDRERDPLNGVFFDRPPVELILALDAYLDEGEVS
jgi:ATP-dependent exoDNAse (exonuclease V) beta subunit